MMGAVVRCGDGLQNKLLGPVRAKRSETNPRFPIPESGCAWGRSKLSETWNCIRRQPYIPPALNDWSTVLDSLGPTVTF
jgi:hypothetical protein